MPWDADAKVNDKRKTEKKVFPLFLHLSSPDEHSGAGHSHKEVSSLPHRQQVDEKSKSSKSWGFSCSPWPCQGAWSCTLALAICSSSWRTLASLPGPTMRSWWQTSPEWRFFKCNKFLDISFIAALNIANIGIFCACVHNKSLKSQIKVECRFSLGYLSLSHSYCQATRSLITSFLQVQYQMFCYISCVMWLVDYKKKPLFASTLMIIGLRLSPELMSEFVSKCLLRLT